VELREISADGCVAKYSFTRNWMALLSIREPEDAASHSGW
jgi:hypothetical protein